MSWSSFTSISAHLTTGIAISTQGSALRGHDGPTRRRRTQSRRLRDAPSPRLPADSRQRPNGVTAGALPVAGREERTMAEAKAWETAGTEAPGAYERRWWILGVLCVSLLVVMIDNTVLNVALPTLVRHLHASTTQLQWIVDAYTLVFAGLLMTAGSLSDHFGRKLALGTGLLVFGAGSAACAFAGSANVLISTRAVMGLGGALIMPSTLSVLIHVFPPQERARAIGIWAGVSGLGIGLGPLIGGELLDHFWWGSVFLINIPIVVVALVAVRLIVPESKDPAAARTDAVGVLLSIAGVVSLIYAINEAPNRGWTDSLILAMF